MARVKSMNEILHKTAMYWYEEGDLDRAAKIMVDLLDCGSDTIKYKAAAFLQDHVYRVWEHDNPKLERRTVTHEFPDSIKVTFVEPGAGVPGGGSRQRETGGEGSVGESSPTSKILPVSET